jgi:S-adenosylmethionine hydrolase
MDSNVQLVTFITDFGTRDYYMGMIKGAVLCQHRATEFIDITHNVKSFDIVQAAFILKNIYSSYPEGTIHVVSVNNYYSKSRRIIGFEYKGQYFVGPDNGVFSLIFKNEIPQAYQLEEDLETAFSIKDVFANAIRHIANREPMEAIGTPVDKIVQRITLQPVINRYQIMGSIIHIDNYENCVVNVSKTLFDRVRGDRKHFAFYFRRNNPIIKLSQHYFDAPVGEPLCIFNSAGYLEIAINMGKASSLLNLNLEDTVQIDFI